MLAKILVQCCSSGGYCSNLSRDVEGAASLEQQSGQQHLHQSCNQLQGIVVHVSAWKLKWMLR
jgi:hypothetical protein